ncbi:MAG: hypothetical protein M1826_004516 [Phylliscum demangeonii]|nr:MAG: hypothetical protein M1826_004516 [Phylliscum demangeonii]
MSESTATSTSAASSKTYHGSCHCQAIKYEAKISPPLEGREINACNCSICFRNGYLFVYVPDDDLRFHSGEDQMTKYSFHKRIMQHTFCPTCGTSMFAKSSDSRFLAGQTGINLRTLQDLDLDALTLKKFDGKNLL